MRTDPRWPNIDLDARTDELQSALAPHAYSVPDFELLVGSGWHDLILQCHRAVVAEFPGSELLAVKEKYGALAFQAFPRRWRRPRAFRRSAWTYEEWDQLGELVEAFKSRSLATCERCGQGGSLREDRRHILTLCDACDAQVTD